LIFEAVGNTLDENAKAFIIGGHPMWQQEFIWFLTIFHHGHPDKAGHVAVDRVL